MSHFAYAGLSDYKRNLDLIPTYIGDTAFYLARCTDTSEEQAAAHVRASIAADGWAPLRDPKILYLASETRGNRLKYEGTFSEYIKTAVENDMPMPPNLTVYHPVAVKKSLSAVYIMGNMQQRSGFKKQQLEAEQRGQHSIVQLYKNLQTTCKVKNNSVSGAHASPHNPLFWKSAHSSLTSTCRISTSYANASNERLLSGNRHYWSPDIVTASITTIVRTADYELLSAAIQQYGIVCPTVQDTMECITYSTELYWRDPNRMSRIEFYVSKLTPIERAAFVYTGDLYHLAKHNPAVIRDFLIRASQTAAAPNPAAEGYLKATHDEDLETLAKMLCMDIVKGRVLKDVKQEAPHDYAIVESTAYGVVQVLDSYALFINAFLRPNTLQPSIFAITSIVRRCVTTSDTDSTIFTSQYWTRWITGSMNFNQQSNAIRDTMTYIVTKTVQHTLRMMSRNLGMADEHLSTVQMKNEYCFPLFGLTGIAKHYVSLVSAKEGNVKKVMDFDVKGVNLRSSNAPAAVTHKLHAWLLHIFKTIMEHGTVSVHELLGPIAELEHEIVRSVLAGEHTYLKSAQTSTASAYKKGEDATPLQHRRFWDEVFGTTYGPCPEAPYSTVKVSLDLDNRTKIKEWIDAIENRAIADKLANWFEATGKTSLGTLTLPVEIVAYKGIPPELHQVLKLRKLVYNVTHPFYLALETFGIFMITKKISRLVSDTYVPPGAERPLAIVA